MITIEEIKLVLSKYMKYEELVTVDRMLHDFQIEDNNIEELESVLNGISQFYVVEDDGIMKYRITFIFSDDIREIPRLKDFKLNFKNEVVSCEEDIPEDVYGIYGLFIEDRVLICIANNSIRDNYRLLKENNAKSKFEQNLFNDGATFKILLSDKSDSKEVSLMYDFKEYFIKGFRDNIDYVVLNNSKGIKQRMKSKTGRVSLVIDINESDIAKILKLLDEHNIDYTKDDVL